MSADLPGYRFPHACRPWWGYGWAFGIVEKPPPAPTCKLCPPPDLALPLLLLSITTLLVLGWLLREPLFTEWRRQRVRRQPFPPEWRQILRQRWPFFHTMPADLQLQLKKHVQVFLAVAADERFLREKHLHVLFQLQLQVGRHRVEVGPALPQDLPPLERKRLAPYALTAPLGEQRLAQQPAEDQQCRDGKKQQGQDRV